MALKLLLVLMVSLGFNCPGCGPPPTLTCDPVSISLDPGTCVEITNPCATHLWERLDSFRLCDAPAGLFIQTQRSPRKRFLCADTSVGTLVDEPVDFFYANTADNGIGQFRVTIATPLAVTASANPMSIQSGGTSQLNAIVNGGAAPYVFSWSGTGLSAANGASPTASPTVTTQYTVVVTDSIGHTAHAAVIVNVGVAATATANPLTINPGQSSQLTVQASGGSPPYTYAWTPASSLNSATVSNPIATPAMTTTYDVTVTDFNGATAIGTVTVQVTAGAVQACFTVSGVGLSRSLDGSCSTGSGLTYRWWCDFRGSAQPPNGAGPNSSFTCLYETPGSKLLRLEVVDGSGTSSATTQSVTVP